jgi:uncharacterized repeat protein (TIGR01451 family)
MNKSRIVSSLLFAVALTGAAVLLPVGGRIALGRIIPLQAQMSGPCPLGQTYDAGTGLCRRICPNGMVWYDAAGQCINQGSCPQGYGLLNGTCVLTETTTKSVLLPGGMQYIFVSPCPSNPGDYTLRLSSTGKPMPLFVSRQISCMRQPVGTGPQYTEWARSIGIGISGTVSVTGPREFKYLVSDNPDAVVSGPQPSANTTVDDSDTVSFTTDLPSTQQDTAAVGNSYHWGWSSDAHTATWAFSAQASGIYDVFVTYPVSFNCMDEATYAVTQSTKQGNPVITTLNQCDPPHDVQQNGKAWRRLARISFPSTASTNVVQVKMNTPATGYTAGTMQVAADAARIERVASYPPVAPAGVTLIDDADIGFDGTALGIDPADAAVGGNRIQDYRSYQGAYVRMQMGQTPNPSSVSWRFAVTSGHRYQVFASYRPLVPNSIQVSYKVYHRGDADSLAAAFNLDQSDLPLDYSFGGVGWKSLGMFPMSTNVLRVSLSYPPYANYNTPAGTAAYMADAVRIVDIDATGSSSSASSVSSSSSSRPSSSSSSSSVSSSSSALPARADITVTQAGPASVFRGGQATYTVTVKNAGDQAANSVVLTKNFPVPSGTAYNPSSSYFSYVPASSTSGCTWKGATIECAPFPLQKGESKIFTFVFQTAPGTLCASTTNDSAARATSEVMDPNPGNNSAPFTTTLACEQADVTLALSTTATALTPGGTVGYSLSARNSGPQKATFVVVKDVPYQGLTFVPEQSDPACSLATDGATVFCTPFDLDAGTSRPIGLTFRVPSDIGCATPLTNSAEVTSVTPDANLSNNKATNTLPSVPCPSTDLTLTQTPQYPLMTNGTALVRKGTVTSFTVTVQNVSQVVAQNVVVTEQVPAGFTLASNAPDHCSMQPGSTTVRCMVGSVNQDLGFQATLSPGESRTLVLPFDVGDAANCGSNGGVQRAIATVTSDTPDSTNWNNNNVLVLTIGCATENVTLSLASKVTDYVIEGGSALVDIFVQTSQDILQRTPLLFQAPKDEPGVRFALQFGNAAGVFCSPGPSPLFSTCSLPALSKGPMSKLFSFPVTIPAQGYCRRSDPTVHIADAVISWGPSTYEQQIVSSPLVTKILCPGDFSFDFQAPTVVTAGKDFQVTLAAQNNSSSELRPVFVFPAERSTISGGNSSLFTFVSSTDLDCTMDTTNLQYVCTGKGGEQGILLPAKSQKTITLTFRVPPFPAMVNPQQNQATGVLNAGVSNIAGIPQQSRTITAWVQGTPIDLSGLSLKQETDAQYTVVGNQSVLTLTVGNSGTANLTDLRVQEQVPPGFLFVKSVRLPNDGTAPQNCSQQYAGGPVLCTFPVLAAQNVQRLQLYFESVGGCNQTGKVIATISGAGSEGSTAAIRSEIEMSTLCTGSLSYSVLSPVSVAPGSDFQATITLRNSSPIDIRPILDVTTPDPQFRMFVRSDANCSLLAGNVQRIRCLADGGTTGIILPPNSQKTVTLTLHTPLLSSSESVRTVLLKAETFNVSGIAPVVTPFTIQVQAPPPSPSSSSSRSSAASSSSSSRSSVSSSSSRSSAASSSSSSRSSVPVSSSSSSRSSSSSAASSAAPQPGGVDLTVTQVPSGQQKAGTYVSFLLSAQNLGSQPASQVVVTDIMPTGFQFMPDYSDKGCTFFALSGIASRVICTGGSPSSTFSLAPGEKKTFNLLFYIRSCPATTVTNSVVIQTINESAPDVNMSNNWSFTPSLSCN